MTTVPALGAFAGAANHLFRALRLSGARRRAQSECGSFSRPLVRSRLMCIIR